MSVKIRLKRFGTSKKPFYRVVVMDSKAPRDGRVIEEVGLYHPTNAAEKQVLLKGDRIKDWLSNGALPSDTVKGLLNKNQIFLK